jgi:Ca-activated chloride channel homolog
MLAIMLPVTLILAAMAINIAYLELSRTEMYIASDSAARATGREFTISNDQNLARAKGRDAAGRNLVQGAPLQLADQDFVFGQASRNSVSDRYQFSAGGSFPNAVEVTARFTASSPNGPLRFLLPNILPGSSVESTQTARSNQIEVDIALVIDRSGSMAYASNEPAVYPPLPAAAPPGWFFDGPAPNPSRWREAVDSVIAFINELQQSPINEQVSLVTYNSQAVIDQNLTANYAAILNPLVAYTNYFQSGATNIGGGITAGHFSFVAGAQREYAAKVMIVLTDGIDTMGSNPVAAATNAADQEIMIFTITFAQEADQATMQQVASVGHGKHYHAVNGANLTAIFKDIARQLPVLISR